MTGIVEISTPSDVALAEHAAVIRALGKRVIGDVIEIGRRLTECKRIAGHGGWLPWLDREFGWTEQTAINFIRVHDMAGKSKKFLDLDIPVSGLYLLAAPSTPDEAREAVIERAANGDAVPLAEIKRLIDEARLAQAGEYAKTIAALRAEADSREAAVRAEYADKLFIEPDELQAEIDKIVGPLKDRYDKLQAQIEGMKRREYERIEKDRAARSKKAAATGETKGLGISAALSLNDTIFRRALADLGAAILKITPAEVLAYASQAAKATNQTVPQWLGDSPHQAKAAIAWLTKFLEEAPR